jgi:hypothetical protein
VAFEAEREPERLREAYIDLENVILSEERDAAARAELREDCLSAWLLILEVQDRYLDPAFDRADVPPRHVPLPPEISFEADPWQIDDPVQRARWEEACRSHEARIDAYRLQMDLHLLNEEIPPRVEAFIGRAYTSDPRDQAELRTAIDRIITRPQRKAALRQLLSPNRA